MQAALASLFTVKYGSIIVMEQMTYAEANPLFGLRQNLFTDPQKPMKVQPGIYPINGADENSICLTTVDFALTYFVVSGELERSGVPCNLIINDAGGLSVLTSWAAGKFSSSSIAKYFQEADKTLVIERDRPGIYVIHYRAYPQKITLETPDTYEMSLDPEVEALVPLYMASELYKDDDLSVATVYRNEFEVGRDALSQGALIPKKEKFIPSSGWA